MGRIFWLPYAWLTILSGANDSASLQYGGQLDLGIVSDDRNLDSHYCHEFGCYNRIRAALAAEVDIPFFN